MIALPYRPPLDWAGLLDWYETRTLPGVDAVAGEAYVRALALPHGTGVARLRHDPEGSRVLVDLELTDARDEAAAVAECRRLLDLDLDPAESDAAVAAVPELAPLVAARPGVRIPGTATPLEALLRALTGQQISVARARALLERLVAVTRPAGEPEWAPFPSAEAVREADPGWFRGPGARRAAIARAVDLAADGGLERTRPPEDVARDLLALSGIGPWTVAYTMMRGFGVRDVDLSGDGALRAAAARLPGSPAVADLLDGARPWRSHAALVLWRA